MTCGCLLTLLSVVTLTLLKRTDSTVAIPSPNPQTRNTNPKTLNSADIGTARRQYGDQQGFYLQGSYTAEQPSYSHHARYVYRSSSLPVSLPPSLSLSFPPSLSLSLPLSLSCVRALFSPSPTNPSYVCRSSDAEGANADKNGAYYHLLLVKVLRGNPLKTTEVWKGKDFSYRRSQLGQDYDSVEGGPHQPLRAGPGADDSIIYVVYHASQCLPEFIVTYREK